MPEIEVVLAESSRCSLETLPSGRTLKLADWMVQHVCQLCGLFPPSSGQGLSPAGKPQVLWNALLRDLGESPSPTYLLVVLKRI